MEAFIASQPVIKLHQKVDISRRSLSNPVKYYHRPRCSTPSKRIQPSLSATRESQSPKVSETTISETTKPTTPLFLSRLSTVQDRKWLHKLPSIIHLSSSFTLLSFGLLHYLLTGLLELPPDQFFNPVYMSWVVSTLIQAFTGSYLAIRYRRNEKVVRNVFVSVGTSSAFNVWMSFYSSQLIPDLLSTPTASLIMTLFLSSVNVFLSLDAFRSAIPILKSRATTTALDFGLLKKHFWSDFLVYVFPILWGLPLFLVVGPATCIYRGHDWVIHLNQQIPGLFPARVYVNMLSSIAATVAAFAVTLRDRKMISKSMEMFLISSTSTSALFMVFFVIFTHRDHVGAILGLG